MSTPSRQPSHSSRNNDPAYQSAFVAQSQRTIAELNNKVKKLEFRINELKNDLYASEERVARRDVRLKSLNEKVSELSEELTIAQANVIMKNNQYMSVAIELQESKKAQAIQAKELSQLKQLNVNLKAHVERTPAPSRKMPAPSLFGPPSSVGLLMPAPADHSQETILHPSRPGSLATVNQSFDQHQSFLGSETSSRPSTTRQSFIGQGPNKRALPAFATAPTSQIVTIRHPSEVRRPDDPELDRKSPFKAAPEDDVVAKAFDDVLSELERFAKKWTLALPMAEKNTLYGPPRSLSREWSSFDNVSAISQVWSRRDLRYMLVARTIADDFVSNKWQLANLYSFPGGTSAVQRLKEIQTLLQSNPSALGHKATELMAEQGRLITSFDRQTAIRDKWNQETSSKQAMDMCDHLRQAIVHNTQCAKELIALYIRAGQLSFMIWSRPTVLKYDFVRGGKSKFWNPFAHEYKNEELKDLKKSQIKKMDMRVLFCFTPVITQVKHVGENVKPSLIRLARVVLSKDGIKADKSSA